MKWRSPAEAAVAALSAWARDPLRPMRERMAADRTSARAAAERLSELPLRFRRKAARLTLRCNVCGGMPLIVYLVDGRLLVWTRGQGDNRQPDVFRLHSDGRRTPIIEAGFHPYEPHWLDTAPAELGVGCQCRCRRWAIKGETLRRAIPSQRDAPVVLQLPLLVDQTV